MSFDMAGSLTSTPTHAGLATSGGGGYPPTAQSTPVTSLHKMTVGGHGHGSLLTTPNLTTSDDQVSAHSTPKTSKVSPTSTRGHNGEAPRTPTPFKRALAAVYSGREPLSNTPQTPTKRVEDITEIINKDMLQYTDLSFNHADMSGDHQVRENINKYLNFMLKYISYRHCKTAGTGAQTRGRAEDLSLTTMEETRRTPAQTERFVSTQNNDGSHQPTADTITII